MSVATSHSDNKTIFGFWAYLMTDCVLFASLFATYAVLRHNTYGGPDGGELFNLPYVLVQTLLLLTSSLTAGLALLAARHYDRRLAFKLLGLTFLLGLSFVAMEVYEFYELVHEGSSWTRSGFLSAFFTLVATHGLHISAGLLWIIVLMRQIYQLGFTANVLRRLTLFSLFWHFLDLIWIFIFTIVYLFGAAGI